MLQYFRTESVQMNSVTIEPETQREKGVKRANIEVLGQDRGGRNNAQINRTGFDSKSQGGINQNFQSNNQNCDQKRSREDSPEDLNTNEYGDKLYNPDGSPQLRTPQMKRS